MRMCARVRVFVVSLGRVSLSRVSVSTCVRLCVSVRMRTFSPCVPVYVGTRVVPVRACVYLSGVTYTCVCLHPSVLVLVYVCLCVIPCSNPLTSVCICVCMSLSVYEFCVFF